jgi:hypothetical protein
MREEEDVEQAVTLLARSYELVREHQARKSAARTPVSEEETEAGPES